MPKIGLMTNRLFLAAVCCVVAAGAQRSSFTVVLLPDTQFYSLIDPATYAKQTEWIVAHRDALNIKFVIHLGDITDENTAAEWASARAAQSRLDSAGIPYSVIPGNHDYPDVGKYRKRDPAGFNATFPPAYFAGKSWYGGHFGVGNENNYTFFEDGDAKFIGVALEWAPRKDVMCWANKILREHPERRAIVSTHCYQATGGGHDDCNRESSKIKLTGHTGATGDALWNELIRQNPNVFLVVSGHVPESEHAMRDRETGGYATATTRDTVHEVLTDYQSERGTAALHLPVEKRSHEHGNGWLRTLEFRRADRRVVVRTISVLNAASFNYNEFNDPDRYSPDTGSPEHQFSFPYNLGAPIPTEPAPALDRFVERSISETNLGHQHAPRVASDSAGNWVGVWVDDRIHARGFDANGCERFSEIAVNVDATRQQTRPAVAMDGAGNFVVIWEAGGVIKARGFDAAGRERFAERIVNSQSTGDQAVRPAIAMNSAGDFVVAWESDGIKVKGFYSGGGQKIAQLAVGKGRRPAVAMSATGDFVIVWEDDDIKARGFKANGAQSFHQFRVNSSFRGQQRRPAIAMGKGGGFVVAWEDDANDNDIYQIEARGFTANGQQALAQFTVNSTASGQQRNPVIAADALGQFVVAWQDDANDNGVYEIKARAFTSAGAELMKQQTVNANSSGQQVVPTLALGPGGRFLVAWQDDVEGAGLWEVLAKGCNWASSPLCDW
jgi:hypothetical protein